MKHFLLAIPLSICAVSIAAPPPDFDTRAETLRKQVGAPGMAIAIVENGEVTFAKGYGVKKLGAADAIDADTIFPTGSTGKAFTVADLAILIEKSELPFAAPEKVIADIARAVYDYFLFADLAQSK
ncbi:MAG: serine hydrolase domain-containing protein [Pseudolabrys sp.]